LYNDIQIGPRPLFKQVQITCDKMSESSSHCAQDASHNSSQDSLKCNPNLL